MPAIPKNGLSASKSIVGAFDVVPVSYCSYKMYLTGAQNCSYNKVMEIVWDEPKRLANLDKHGLDFADIDETFFDNALVIPSRKSKRWVAIGVSIRGVVVVFARLGREGVSIISMRPASRSERSLYAER
jgi:uncharacterized DUF497 family protein